MDKHLIKFLVEASAFIFGALGLALLLDLTLGDGSICYLTVHILFSSM